MIPARGPKQHYILEIGGCELVKVSPNREMLCKRCEHVSECECNVIREGVAFVVRSFYYLIFLILRLGALTKCNECFRQV